MSKTLKKRYKEWRILLKQDMEELRTASADFIVALWSVRNRTALIDVFVYLGSVLSMLLFLDEKTQREYQGIWALGFFLYFFLFSFALGMSAEHIKYKRREKEREQLLAERAKEDSFPPY